MEDECDGREKMPRRKKSARERREQKERAAGRHINAIMKSLQSLNTHRGASNTNAGSLLLNSLRTALPQLGKQTVARTSFDDQELPKSVSSKYVISLQETVTSSPDMDLESIMPTSGSVMGKLLSELRPDATEFVPSSPAPSTPCATPTSHMQPAPQSGRVQSLIEIFEQHSNTEDKTREEDVRLVAAAAPIIEPVQTQITEHSIREKKLAVMFTILDENADQRLSYPEVSRVFSVDPFGDKLKISQYIDVCAKTEADLKEGFTLQSLQRMYDDKIADVDLHFTLLQGILLQEKALVSSSTSTASTSLSIAAEDLVAAVCAWEIHTILASMSGKPYIRAARIPILFKKKRSRELKLPDNESIIEFVSRYPFIFSIVQSPEFSSSDLALPDDIDIHVSAVQSHSILLPQFNTNFHEGLLALRNRHINCWNRMAP
eukprot:gnl/TRDRNA2_/TRDRNA2_37534_c0_seq1.p1 gnl/TRDRNA2_/TRDRNA2_37534_c0~~gnl/TRDRNA2_/TRDRNA2_37534_c0_seq1.p1  ORF type:complete len:433 (+),score=42.20 gnl/TRDRNA2_/TRDRNA2_37534_c0_seq1:262-1560(+)